MIQNFNKVTADEALDISSKDDNFLHRTGQERKTTTHTYILNLFLILFYFPYTVLHFNN